MMWILCAEVLMIGYVDSYRDGWSKNISCVVFLNNKICVHDRELLRNYTSDSWCYHWKRVFYLYVQYTLVGNSSSGETKESLLACFYIIGHTLCKSVMLSLFYFFGGVCLISSVVWISVQDWYGFPVMYEIGLILKLAKWLQKATL